MAGEYKYKRVLLKLSGEALAGDQGYGIDPKIVDSLADELVPVVQGGVELCVVVGGGNIFRGRGHGPLSGRLHWHAGNCYEFSGSAGSF